jgi:iron complex outermembrane receptor protein
LFGKNNDAGVINITTKRPSQTFSATGEVTGGNYSDREINASVTGPLSDTVAARLYVGYQRRDGWLNLDNGIGPYTARSTDDRNTWTTRGQVLFTPTSNIDVLLIADISKRNESCCGAVPIDSGPFEAITNAIATFPILGGNGGTNGGAISLTPQTYTAWANQPVVQTVRDYGFSGEFNWDLDWSKLTSITAWRDNTQGGGNDFDYSGIDLLQSPPTAANTTDFKQFSQELRLAGKVGPLQWLGGLFYARETLTPNGQLYAGNNFEEYIGALASASIGTSPPNFGLIPSLTGNAPNATFIPGVAGYQDSYVQRENSFAFFTDETWTIVEGLDLTGGLRYTSEHKSSLSNYHDTDGGLGCGTLLSPGVLGQIATTGNEAAFLLGYGCSTVFNPLLANVQDRQSLTEHNTSGTGKLAYHFTSDLMVYGSWSDGFKAGGINLARVTVPVPAGQLGIVPDLDTRFGAETVQAYELGFKSSWFEHSLRVNFALFDEKFSNFQLNTFTGIQFVVTSLPKVSSKGGDLDVAWATPIKGLSLSGGATYAFTNIDNFGNALIDFDPENGGPPRLNDRLSFAPLWSMAGSVTYSVPLPDSLALRFIVDEKYNTSYNTGSDLDPRKIQGGYGLMDARIGFGPQDGKWSVELWSQNLLNKFYDQVAFDAPFQYQQIDLFPGAPRFWGLTAKVKF